jgi:pimeloyl-ACP methyl ester carboxylesterase
LAAIADLSRAFELNAGIGAVKEFLGGAPEEFPDRYTAASPMALLPMGVRQLIVHGVKDATLPIDLSRKYAAAAKASGDIVEWIELSDAGHMDFVDPDSKAHATLCAWLTAQAGGAGRA